MFVCPICNLKFNSEAVLVKHYSKCWREQNPHFQSKPAPRSEDINTREVSEDIANFFNSFK